MKTTLLIIAMLVTLESCGKNKTGTGQACRSRHQKIVECFQANQRHHPQYTERLCNESYPVEGCYK